MTRFANEAVVRDTEGPYVQLEFNDVRFDESNPEDILSFETVMLLELPTNVGRMLLSQLNDFYSLEVA